MLQTGTGKSCKTRNTWWLVDTTVVILFVSQVPFRPQARAKRMYSVGQLGWQEYTKWRFQTLGQWDYWGITAHELLRKTQPPSGGFHVGIPHGEKKGGVRERERVYQSAHSNYWSFTTRRSGRIYSVVKPHSSAMSGALCERPSSV
jgi:hypothetical protein